jgi:hypothetical protein
MFTRLWDSVGRALSGSVSFMADLVAWSKELAESLMAEELPRRWGHVQSVAAKAQRLSPALRGDGELLVASAWLHDIGYVTALQDTGFHPIDGARYLRSRGADVRLYCLVANHSGARFEAPMRGLDDAQAEYADESSLARDGLWYADMTTSPVGEPVRFSDRLREIRERYGPEHSVPRAITEASEEIEQAISHVYAAAEGCGIALD